MSPLHIGVDMHVVDGYQQGSKTHLLNLYDSILKIDNTNKYYFFLKDVKSLASFSSNFTNPNVQIIKINYFSRLDRLAVVFPFLEWKYKLNYSHYQYIAPPIRFSKRLITVHDVLFEDFPEYFDTMFLLTFKRLVKYSCQNAFRIYTVSKYSAIKIMDHYNPPKEKVKITYNACSQNIIDYTDDSIILEKYNLAKFDYVFSIGRHDKRKNYINSIKAFAKSKINIKYVIVGKFGSYSQHILKVIKKYNLAKQVVLLEEISNHDLHILLKFASFTVYLSFAEGFGLPVIESINAKTPCLTSNNTAMGELLDGENIMGTDPNNINKMSNLFKSFVEKPRISDDVVKNYNEIYNWTSSAEVFLQSLRL